jgi:hypothetical protein
MRTSPFLPQQIQSLNMKYPVILLAVLGAFTAVEAANVAGTKTVQADSRSIDWPQVVTLDGRGGPRRMTNGERMRR